MFKIKNPITVGKGVEPSGTKEITSNGTHDVAEFKSANVNVPIPSGYIKPSGIKYITENDTYDVSQYSSVNVNVEGEIPDGYVYQKPYDSMNVSEDLRNTSWLIKTSMPDSYSSMFYGGTSSFPANYGYYYTSDGTKREIDTMEIQDDYGDSVQVMCDNLTMYSKGNVVMFSNFSGYIYDYMYDEGYGCYVHGSETSLLDWLKQNAIFLGYNDLE